MIHFYRVAELQGIGRSELNQEESDRLLGVSFLYNMNAILCTLLSVQANEGRYGTRNEACCSCRTRKKRF